MFLLTPSHRVLGGSNIRHGLDPLAMWNKDKVSLNITKCACAISSIEVVDRTDTIPSFTTKDCTHELDPVKNII